MPQNESFYPNGAIKDRMDDDARLYTSWAQSGSVTAGPRAYTPAENAAADARALVIAAGNNRDAIIAKVQAALDSNNAFLANGSPSAAQIATQVQRLTRQVNGLLRLQKGDLSTIADS